jgi:hypothetical protein
MAASFNTQLEQLAEILQDMDSVIANGKNKSEVLEKNFGFVIEKIKKNEIQVRYDSKLPFGLAGCAKSERIDDAYYFVFGDFVLDVYKTFPYLSHGIIIHEFQHLHDFYNHSDLMVISDKNPIEKSYFEIDGLTLEALYFKYYTPEGAVQSAFEKYLASDIDNGLAGTATLFEQVDISVLHQMDNIRYEETDFDNAITHFVEIGKQLETKITYGDNAWKNYCQTVTLRTYVFFSKQVLHDLLFTLKKVNYSNEELDVKKYPTFYNQVEKISKVYTTHAKDLGFQTKMMNQFDASIKEKIK